MSLVCLDCHAQNNNELGELNHKPGCSYATDSKVPQGNQDGHLADTEGVKALSSKADNPFVKERFNNYMICKQRGHRQDVNDHTAKYPKKRCKFCQTIFWEEKVVHEEEAPAIAPEYQVSDLVKNGEGLK